MIKSMTAYGSAEHREGDTLFVAEMKSLNNRFRDVILRIPKNLQSLEDEIRGLIALRVRRGRIEVTLQMDNGPAASASGLALNVPLVNAYLGIFRQLAQDHGLDPKVSVESFCQMKEVILFRADALDVDSLRPGIRKVLAMAMDSLDQMRTKEGKSMEVDLVSRLKLLASYVQQVQERAPRIVEEHRRRLTDRVRTLLQDLTVDETRIGQEVALFAERSDITEELVRLQSHLGQFQEYMGLDDMLGKRLEFLIQEMHREVNTLSSKASDVQVSKIVVEMKAELEKLREQVQNVE